jgi:hypothetical protein
LGLLSLLSSVLANQVVEFLLYAGFLLVATGVFFLLSKDYVCKKDRIVDSEMKPLAEATPEQSDFEQN